MWRKLLIGLSLTPLLKGVNQAVLGGALQSRSCGCGTHLHAGCSAHDLALEVTLWNLGGCLPRQCPAIVFLYVLSSLCIVW